MDELDPVERARLELLEVPRGPIRLVDEPTLLGPNPNDNGKDPVPNPGPPPPLPWADPEHDVLADLRAACRDPRERDGGS